MGLSLSRLIPGVLVACVAASAANAQIHTLYENNFESGRLGSEWTGPTSVDSHYQRYFSVFNGRYTNDTITLSLDPAPNPGAGKYNLYTLRFDLYVIDSWDGNNQAYGPDTFAVSLGNTKLFLETFSNQDTNQTYARRPDAGPYQMGFNNSWKDSIYRNIAVQFTAPQDQKLKLSFTGKNLQSMSDESWGIDNVRVRYESVPAPGAAALLGMGGLLAARRRRS
ncbi:MAG: PEP-CTERM sorting domain-containing protein [Phycisphaerales bacterium]|nr:PEP-CTERM sorting domain-containing protein [Phycisphaerales bacterium]